MWNMPDGICPAWLKQTLRAQFCRKNFTGENIWSHDYVSPTWCFSRSNPDRLLLLVLSHFNYWGKEGVCLVQIYGDCLNLYLLLMATKHIKKSSLLWKKVNQSGAMNQWVWIPSIWVKTNSVVSICNPSASMRGWKLRSHQAWHTHIKITPVAGKTNRVGCENIHWVWLSQKTEWRLSIIELWNSKARRILLMLIFEKCGLTKDLYKQGSNDQLQERHTFMWETLNMMNFNQSEQLFATCYLLSIVHCAMKDGHMTSSPRYTKQSLNVWGRMCM